MRMIAVVLSIGLPLAAAAQAPVEYDVSFDNAVHHEARITVTWRDVQPGTLSLRMSRSSPGRYALHEFGKNVYNVWVVDGEGNPLQVTRPDPYQWDVSGHDGTVSATYTLYADRAGGTYSGIDATHAHLNMPATFMWARGNFDRPIRISFTPYDPEWKVATQLVPTDDEFVYTAPDYQYFMDSPTELSDFDMRSWSVSSGGNDYQMRLAVHHAGSEADVDRFLEMAKKIVTQHTKVYGELPAFDHGTYTFIADYLPWVSGDGMEHRNSTVISNPQSFVEANFGQLGTLSHEFFHAWNVERIRPVGLQPFDFERANMSDSLWFAEGFTSYYGVLAMRRAGESDLGSFASSLGFWIDAVSNSPGRRFAAPPGMSIQAPFVDAATAIDPTNFDNTFISYYTYGAAIAVALDLAIRAEFDGKSLDDLMRQMWIRYGKTEIPYLDQDIVQALADVTGRQRFAEDFFGRFVFDSELPNYQALLDRAGLLLRPAHEGRAWPGPVSFDFNGDDAIIGGNTIIGTPLYEAGLDRGDQVLAVDRLDISSQGRWDAAIGRYKPGDTATIRYIQRGREVTADLVFAEDPGLELVSYESAGRELTDAQRRFREQWLGADRGR